MVQISVAYLQRLKPCKEAVRFGSAQLRLRIAIRFASREFSAELGNETRDAPFERVLVGRTGHFRRAG